MENQTEGDRFLIQKLEELLNEARLGEFGDFTNDKYPAPKIELRQKFLQLSEMVVNGDFD